MFRVLAALATGVVASSWLSPASGQLIDPLDGRPLRWRLVDADGPAEVHAHWLDATGGHDRRPCEAITLATGNGTRAILEYRIEPSQVIEEVRARVSVQAVREGVRVGLRMRYPRVIDPATRAPLVSILWGQVHRGRGQWETLEVRADTTQRRLREMAIRREFGGTADLGGAYIDAVVINAYTGQGASTIHLDQLRVDGLVAVGTSPGSSVVTAERDAAPDSEVFDPSAVESAFPAGRLTRVIEYNGEPLDYLQMLGFDAVLLARPPTAELLRDAARQAITVYAPPPTAPDPELEPLLAPIAGWYLGTSLDDSQLELTAEEAKRIDRLPRLWQRPAMLAPAESWDRYGGIATSLVYDLPPAVRGLSGQEQVRLLSDQLTRTGRPVAAAVGVATMPPQRLTDQLDAISRGVGAPAIEDYGWRWVWLQAAEAVKVGPRAIVFRSTRSLASGREADLQRAAVLGMINRWLEIVGPAVSGSQLRGELRSSREDYHLAHVAGSRVDVVVATRSRSPRSVSRLGDPPTAGFPAAASSADAPSAAEASGPAAERPLEFHVPGGQTTFAWRLSSGVVEQLQLIGEGATAKISLESPDLVEWIVLSDDPTLGRRLDRVVRRHSEMLNQERWQLVSDDLMRTREDWRSAVSVGLVPRTAVPARRLREAAEALADVQPIIATGRLNVAMRATQRADAIASESRQLLAGRLHPAGVAQTAMPTRLAPGATVLQLAWRPILDNGQWTDNILAGGELDDSDEMIRSGWTHQKRLETIAETNVGVDPAAGSDGRGALRIESAARGNLPLPGGYAGTVIRVRSGPVTVPAGSWIRIEARVRTLGFGGPHQGLLVYDSDAGSEIGTLVRGESDWHTVALYRMVTSERPMRVIFEGIGSGEALIDWVRVSMWQPATDTALPLRPLAANR